MHEAAQAASMTLTLPFLCSSLIHCPKSHLLLVGGDGDICSGVGHAGQHKALVHLVVVQEALVALVNVATLNLAGAAGASACGQQQKMMRTLRHGSGAKVRVCMHLWVGLQAACGAGACRQLKGLPRRLAGASKQREGMRPAPISCMLC